QRLPLLLVRPSPSGLRLSERVHEVRLRLHGVRGRRPDRPEGRRDSRHDEGGPEWDRRAVPGVPRFVRRPVRRRGRDGQFLLRVPVDQLELECQRDRACGVERGSLQPDRRLHHAVRRADDQQLLDRDSTSPHYGDVYVSWDHFTATGTTESWVARCTPALVCTMLAGDSQPPLYATDPYPVFTTPAVGSDGAAHFTWCNYGTATTL